MTTAQTLSDMQLLSLMIFAVTAGITLAVPGTKSWVRWIACVSGIVLGVVCLLILLKVS